MLIFIQARSIGRNGCHAKQVKSRENSYKDLIENEFKEKRHNYIITEGKKKSVKLTSLDLIRYRTMRPLNAANVWLSNSGEFMPTYI